MDGGLAFDHGAQFVTARSAGFRAVLDGAAEAGSAARWQPEDEDGWFVGVPGMSALVKGLGTGCEIRLGSAVSGIVRDRTGWRISLDDGRDAGRFDAVVVTTPQPQARALLSRTGLGDAIEPVETLPCWALMLAFPRPLGAGVDLRRWREGPLALLARNSSKPGRPQTPECWVAHAAPDWSRAHLELRPEDACDRLVALVAAALGGRVPQPAFAAAHRWRYAMTARPLGQPFAREGSLYAGGDWTTGGRVEAAFESGEAIAEDLARRLG